MGLLDTPHMGLLDTPHMGLVTTVLPALIDTYPPPRLHQRSLSRRVRVLQTVPEGGVLRINEPVGEI
jgi:hypothetical protein